MKLTVCLCPRPAETDWLVCGSKPSASTLTEYEPGFSCGKLKRPASSVLALRFDPVSVLTIVTVAPAMAAPLGSITVPDNGAGGFALGHEVRREAGQASRRSEQRRCERPPELGIPNIITT